MQEQDGKVNYRAYQVFGRSEDRQAYTFHLFDSFGANPASPAHGSWKDNVLNLEQDSYTASYLLPLS
ncbi:hypothetical protein [Leptolyngbya sp. FACHB-261]|uniref:hypothetical protein n=1 Tax=Leptolyngbya sp. FACHB-261 TaxID=2692806 RepID=UPI001688CFE3|nr:hypothetical protein [Leptolyngbya sp. FACHB-261]